MSAVGASAKENVVANSTIVASSKEVSFDEIVDKGAGESGENVPLRDVVVTVERGESLSGILRANLGSLKALWEVAGYNRLDTPNTLEPGQKILIPANLFLNPPDLQ